jgi:acetyl-CoA carboxylase biotin carboxyl carrier protein
VDLTSDDIQDILQLLDSLPFGEMHLQTARFRLSLRRTANGEWTQELTSLPEPSMLPGGEADQPARAASPGPAPAGPAPASTRPASTRPASISPGGATMAGQPQAGQPQASEPQASEPQAGRLSAVRAPLLGTFYRAPRPGAPPFVEVGSPVNADTVIGIIETMKLMNSVCAGVRGTVAEILVADAQFAEQGSPLMRVLEEQ